MRLMADQGSVAVCWMLTPDDGGPDGRKNRYIDQPKKYRDQDPELFDFLKRSLDSGVRDVMAFETSGLLRNSRFFSDLLTDDRTEREKYFQTLISDISRDADLTFFDPDNGLEIKSTKKGNKDSSKFLYFDEVKVCYDLGRSLLIFQHFPRMNHSAYTVSRVQQLQTTCPTSNITTYTTTNVVYFLLGQPNSPFQFPSGGVAGDVP